MSSWPRIVRALLFLCAYFLGAELGHFLSFPGDFATFWPPGGLYLTALLIARTRNWPMYISAALAGNVASDSICHGLSLATVFGFWSANTIAATVGAWIIRRIRGRAFTVDDPRDVVTLALVIAFGAAPLSAFVGASVASQSLDVTLKSVYLNWWSCSVVGALLFVPGLITAHTIWRRRFQTLQLHRLPEAIGVLVGLASITLFIFSGPDRPWTFLISPFLLWMAFRFEVGGVSTAMMLMAGLATWQTVHGRGPFADVGPSATKALILQGFLGIYATAFLLMATVVRQRGRTAADVRTSESRYRDLFENVNDMIHSLRPDGSILYANRAWREVLGYSEEDVRTLNIFQVIHFKDRVECQARLQQLVAGEDIGPFETRFVTKTGAVIYVEGQSNCRFENGQAIYTRAIFRDVTEQRRQMRQLERIRRDLQEANARLRLAATTDGLTGLNNRSAFQKKLAEEVGRSTRYGYSLSLLLIDVDHFKEFNDTYGHSAGDEALIAVAKLLQTVARGTDFVARFGGEEFTVLLPHTTHDGADILAERVRRIVAEARWPLRAITVCVGAATLTNDVCDGPTLVRQADAALYYCKKHGRNRSAHASTLSPPPAEVAIVDSAMNGASISHI